MSNKSSAEQAAGNKKSNSKRRDFMWRPPVLHRKAIVVPLKRECAYGFKSGNDCTSRPISQDENCTELLYRRDVWLGTEGSAKRPSQVDFLILERCAYFHSSRNAIPTPKRMNGQTKRGST